MATKKQSQAQPDGLRLLEDYVPQAELDIEDFLEEWAPQTVVVEIYQHMKDGGKPHQERIGIEILRADLFGYLRENYGGGKFELQFKDANRRIRKTLTVQVGAGPKGAQVQAVNGKSDTGGDYMKELMITLIASMKPAPAPDVGAMMTGLAALMTAVQQKPSTTDSPAAMLNAMAATFNVLKPKEADSLGQFKEMVSLAKDLMPSSERPVEENMYTVIKDLGNKAVEAFTGRIGGAGPEAVRALPPGGPPVRPLAPVRAGIGVTPEIVPAGQPAGKTQQQILQDWLRVQLQYLKDKAFKKKDVDFWIDYVLINDDEPGCAAIISAIEAGARFEDLLAFDADIADNPELLAWFKTFYDGLHAEIVKSVDSAGAGGNAGDTGNYAGSGQEEQPIGGGPQPGGAAKKPDSVG